MNKSARCAPRLNAREAAENAEMLLIAAEQCAEILADLPRHCFQPLPAHARLCQAVRGDGRTLPRDIPLNLGYLVTLRISIN